MTRSAPPRAGGDPDFAHLLEVCREAMRRGNPRPAEILLASCRTERELCRRREQAVERSLAAKRALTRAAEDKARAIAAVLGTPGEPPAFDPGSPQTAVKARRRRDPLARLALSDRQAAAANEIAEIFEAMTLGLRGTVRPLLAERVDAGFSGREPFRAMPARLAEARRARYLPWAERHKGTVATREAEGIAVERLTGVGLAVTVLIDKVPVRALEGLYRVRNGVLAGALKAALDDYWPAGPGR